MRGAAGGVGTALVSHLASLEVEVVATAKPEDQSRLAALGAKQFTGYDTAGYPADLDAIFNLAVPGYELSDVADHLRSGGRLVSITMPQLQPDMISRQDVEAIFMADTEGQLAAMEDVASVLQEGKLTPEIAATFGLDDAAAAYAAYAGKGTVGKIVVLP